MGPSLVRWSTKQNCVLINYKPVMNRCIRSVVEYTELVVDLEYTELVLTAEHPLQHLDIPEIFERGQTGLEKMGISLILQAIRLLK